MKKKRHQAETTDLLPPSLCKTKFLQALLSIVGSSPKSTSIGSPYNSCFSHMSRELWPLLLNEPELKQ